MGFQTKNSNTMMVKIDHSSRETSGYSSLQVHLKDLEYRLDDGGRSEILREWNANHGDQRPGQQLALVENYLRQRYGFRVTATPYDGEDHSARPTGTDRESLRSYPFSTYTVTRGRGCRFPWTWERTEVYPFNRVFNSTMSFDTFGFDTPWQFSGGASRPMAEDVLDAAPGKRAGRPPCYVCFHKKLDGVIITVDVVDLATSSNEVVATLEDHWSANLFGTAEDDQDPRRLRRELQR